MRKAKALQRLSSAPLPFVFPKIPPNKGVFDGVHGEINQYQQGDVLNKQNVGGASHDASCDTKTTGG